MGVILGLAAFAALTWAIDVVWRLLAEHVPDWWLDRDARTAARRARTLEALGRIHDRGRR